MTIGAVGVVYVGGGFMGVPVGEIEISGVILEGDDCVDLVCAG